MVGFVVVGEGVWGGFVYFDAKLNEEHTLPSPPLHHPLFAHRATKKAARKSTLAGRPVTPSLSRWASNTIK